MKHLRYSLLLSFLSFTCIEAWSRSGETDSVSSKPHDIIIVSKYGDVLKGRLTYVSFNDLTFIGRPYNSDSALKQFYLKNDFGQYTIDAAYIRSVTMKPAKVVGARTLAGAVIGAVLLGSIVYKLDEDHADHFLVRLGNTAIGAGIGALAGAGVGFTLGLFSRKRIRVNGDPYMLSKLNRYLQ